MMDCILQCDIAEVAVGARFSIVRGRSQQCQENAVNWCSAVALKAFMGTEFDGCYCKCKASTADQALCWQLT
jgi:hypothetical protein